MDIMNESDKFIRSMVDYPSSDFWTFVNFISSIKIDKQLYYHFSIQEAIETRFKSMMIINDDFIQSVEAIIDDRMNGFGISQHSTLLVRFETLLNSIYSFLEFLAYYGYCVHRKLGKTDMPRKFNTQLISASREKGYQDYLALIKSCEHWYNSFLNHRSSAVHFFPGYLSISIDNTISITYLNEIEGERSIKGNPDPIVTILDIVAYIQILISEIMIFITKYAKYFLEKFVDENSVATFRCFHQDKNTLESFAGLREVSLSDYKKREYGKCVERSPNPCPLQTICPAYMNFSNG